MTGVLVSVLSAWLAAGPPADTAPRPALPEVADPPSTPVRPQEPAADRWLAEDKLQHFGVSFAATHMAYGGARTVLDREPAAMVALIAAAALGVGKEVVDRRRGGPFSLRDLVWDLGGVALGAVLIDRMR